MNTKLIIYGRKFSADAVNLEGCLDRNGIAYEWRDIAEGDPDFKKELLRAYNASFSASLNNDTCWLKPRTISKIESDFKRKTLVPACV